MARPLPSIMGGGNSKQADDVPNGISEQDIEYPFKIRRKTVDGLRDVIKKVNTSTSMDSLNKEFKTQMGNVREALLINEAAKQTGDTLLLVDKTSLELVTLLDKIWSSKGEDWRKECEVVCQVLTSHISPPHIPGIIPDTQKTNITILNLVNIRVKSQKGLNGLLTVLQNNQRLEKIELGYTGITIQTYQQAHKHIVKLQQLTYLGLRGNRLDNSIVTLLNKSIQNKKTLPKLLWIDLANNTDIVTIPSTLLNQLKLRWPKDFYVPTFRELFDSKIVVHQKVFSLNI